MDNLNEMAVFARVIDCRGFSAAARDLGLTTSAVSRSVARLEAQLGVRLLHRTTRAMTPTELGQQVYEACLRMLAEARGVHNLAGRYSEQPTGTLRVSAPVMLGQVWLAGLMPSFLSRHTDLKLRLSLLDRQVDLVEDGVDVAIRIARELAPGLVARKLFEVRYVLVASPQYLHDKGSPEHPSELPDHACIFLGYDAFDGEWTLCRRNEGQLTLETVVIGNRLTANNSGAILAMVQAHGGIGLVPDFTARAALEQGVVAQVLPEWDLQAPYCGTAYAIYLPGKHVPLKTRAFIDHLIAHPPSRQ